MKVSTSHKETFFTRVMIIGNTVYSFDKSTSIIEDGELCLKFLSNITSGTKYESEEDARKERFLKYSPLKSLAILTENDEGQIRLNKITEQGPMEEFFKNLHIMEVEATVKIKNLMRG